MLTNFTNLIPSPRVLMVSTEYPPMQGGVGRYTFNLTKELCKIGFDRHVACSMLGKGDFFGLSPYNPENSEVLLKIVDELRPDLVHVQYEHGLYGLVLDAINPKKTCTNIDSFYRRCKTPIITTFHSAYSFKQWLNLIVPVKHSSKLTHSKRYSNNIITRYWKSLLNYRSFHNLNKQKLVRSATGIVFSSYMSKMVGGCEVIFHGAESMLPPSTDREKKEARRLFNLPENDRIALAIGFMTATKGWDILKKMEIPPGWTVVVNSSKNHYNIEDYNPDFGKNGIINLEKDFLSEEEHSSLLSSADAVILPYKVSSGSGVMFDALAHGLPFVATNLEFFKEFSEKGLGITVRRKPEEFSKALVMLDKEYSKYRKAVEAFRNKISWQNIAAKHAQLYNEIANKKASILTTVQVAK
jgi:glycosyltransferase involved in cell wall biosynthesis